jgi:hypothetical protein
MTKLVEQRLRSARFVCDVVLGLLLCAALSPAMAQQAPQERSFIVFDSIRSKGKPDLRSFGLAKTTAVFGHQWAKPGMSKGSLDESGVTRTVEKAVPNDADDAVQPGSGIVFLDIENLPLYGVSQNMAQAHITRLVKVADLARASRPHARLGFYGVLPVRVFAPIIGGDPVRLGKWREANRRAEPLARHVDFIAPSLYTLDDDPKHWEAFAKAMLEEAHRYGLPVYPFIWPEYHDSNPQLRGQLLPAAFWRQQLEFCAQHADGVVIWGSAHDTWDAKAPWWSQTQDFMRQHHLAKQ